MATLNKVMQIGRLGKDPDVRMAGTTKVATFSIAVSEKYKNEEKTQWFDVKVWAKLADIVEQYVKKGTEVLVDGKLEKEEWDDKDGNKRSRIVINAFSLQMLGARSEGGQSSQQPIDRQEAENYNQMGNQNQQIEDDLPF